MFMPIHPYTILSILGVKFIKKYQYAKNKYHLYSIQL